MPIRHFVDGHQKERLYVTVEPANEEDLPTPNLFLQSRKLDHKMIIAFGVCKTGKLPCRVVRPFEAKAPNKPSTNITSIQVTGKALVDRMGEVMSMLPDDENGKMFSENVKGLIGKAN
ncbi:MAG: hypothetical protein Q9174_003794 [Haloplaca sp. 1 TL-2023]